MKRPVDSLNSLRELQDRLEAQILRLAEPTQLNRLKIMVLGLLAIWAVFSLTRGLWLLLPAPSVALSTATVINPPVVATADYGSVDVDVDSLLGLSLFGDAITPELPELTEALVENPRDGIEAGARETQLDITLTGIVASTDDGLGSVIIERSGAQVLYGVGDNIAGLDRVKLAKVMAQQVVLDNRGTYELLKLFDDDALPIAVQPASTKTVRGIGSGDNTAPDATKRVSADQLSDSVLTGSRAQQVAVYRDRLYSNSQSLAMLVNVSAVRQGGQLRGYRITPGVDPELFSSLGLKAGDIITSVNGYALSEPSNAAKLYQMMRDVTQATIELERNGASFSVAVNLDQ